MNIVWLVVCQAVRLCALAPVLIDKEFPQNGELDCKRMDLLIASSGENEC